MKEINELWLVLEEADKPMELKEACGKAGLHWYDENGGGCNELEEYINHIRKYQSKRFLRKIMQNTTFQRTFIESNDFMILYLLKTKTKHPAIDMLFGPDSAFSILNWTEMRANRRRYDNE
jgi:hypothetical protein